MPSLSITSVVLNKPATTTSIRDSAICAQTKLFPSHLLSARRGRFADWRIIASGVVRLSIHAGAMPQSSAQKTAQLAVTVSTVASGRIESAIGNLLPLADKRRSRMRHPIHPNASPNKPPGTATARLRAERQEHRRYCHSQYFLAQPAILNEFSVRKNRAIRVSRIGRYLETWLGNLA